MHDVCQIVHVDARVQQALRGRGVDELKALLALLAPAFQPLRLRQAVIAGIDVCEIWLAGIRVRSHTKTSSDFARSLAAM
ncbi:hypothetical protein [Janthinobacterium sp. UMAB-56]|uniref:hypothetical protein n=1 Tax=Janthinobacterium sp. UMAB-56 TaxID=1365361 RepID=UPI001C5657ED|nr:hypothetical protein [Janthinobacterium sp. UMAB-56]